MGKFFRRMSSREVFNSKKGLIFGFYTYMLVSAIDYFYYLFKSSSLFSPIFVFWSGLVAFFIFELLLNTKDTFTDKGVRKKFDKS